jgi:glutamate 5-kinase
MKKVLVKVGTNVLTKASGELDLEVLQALVKQIVTLQNAGIQVILVSSGAMGAGRSLIKWKGKKNTIAQRQVLAAVGQIKLMETYLREFQMHDACCAQVLATKEDFRDRMHYLNMKNCFDALLEQGVTPIVNENDVVSVAELMFTDNDELAGLIASMMDMDMLILLTSVPGILDANEKRISEVQTDESVDEYIHVGKSSFGRGGMKTKAHMASKLAKMGIDTFIADGKVDNILLDILAGKDVGTRFIPEANKKSSIKRWLAHSEGHEKGSVHLNEYAGPILKDTIASLLPVGVTKVNGEFEKGDILKIYDYDGSKFGYGMAAYGHEAVKKVIGQKDKKPLIKYDHLVINEN